MKRTFLPIVAFSILASTFCACSPQQPSGRQQVGGQVARPESAEIALTVVVQTQAQQAISGVEVTVSSNLVSDKNITGPTGQTYLKLVHEYSAPLEFDFNAKSIRWSNTFDKVPPGVTEATIYFTVDTSTGKVLFSRMEY